MNWYGCGSRMVGKVVVEVEGSRLIMHGLLLNWYMHGKWLWGY